MRTSTVLIAIALIAACKKAPPPAPQPARPVQTAATAAASSDAIRGTVAEKIDAGQYSYLKLRTGSGEVWTAVPQTDKATGAEVAVVNVAWMMNFESKTLNRTWERIAFGTLEESGAAKVPADHPAVGGAGAGMFAAEAAGQGGLHPHPAAAAPADVGVVKVAKAPGPSGRTIADIWQRRAQFKDQKVAVRGKVVKATNGVMGKNWLHLRDGTGEGPSADLTVASVDSAAVGDTVLVTGIVRLDRDLGAGYHYDVIVEDARIKTE